MKVTFNQLGVVTNVDYENETIRQGMVGLVLKAKFIGKSNYNYTANFNFTRHDGESIANIAMGFDSTDVNTFVYTFNDEWWLAKAGATTLTVFLHDSYGNIVASGQVQFNVEGNDYDDDPENITNEQYNALLALLNTKLSRYESILKVNSLDALGDLSMYDVGQAIYVKNENDIKFYEIDSNHQAQPVKDLNELVAKTHLGNKIYGTNRYGQETTYDVSNEVIADFIPKRDSNGQIKVPANPTSDNDAVSKAHLEKRINEENGYRLTKNADGDRFDTFAELESATTFYYAGQVRIPTKNDIATVVSDENHDGATTRYFYAGTTYPDGQWTLDEIINESPLTQEQLDALDSGITSAKVEQYDNYATSKQDTIDDLTDIRNNAQAGKNASDSLPNYRTSADQDIIDNEIRQIAEGRTKSYSLNIATAQTDNALFNNSDNELSIPVNANIKVFTPDGYEEQRLDLSTLRVGDIIYIYEENLPDRWFAGSDSDYYYFMRLEGIKDYYNKVDSDARYARKNADNTFEGNQTFIDGIRTDAISDASGENTISFDELHQAIGTTLINNTATSVNRALMTNNVYIYKQPLTSLVIASLEALSTTVFREWRITFKPASGFNLTMPSDKTFKFAEGEPFWDTSETYTLVITDGIDTDFIIYVVRG